jgi:hypothetical protein
VLSFTEIGGFVETEIVACPAEPGAEFGLSLKVPVADPAGIVIDDGTGTRVGFELER